MNKTLQDRLVKELRLRGICSMAAGNTYLPAFIEDYNRRFGRAPGFLPTPTGLSAATRISSTSSPGRSSAV